MDKWIESISLENDLVQLLPLTTDHRDALLEAAADGELWNLWFTLIPDAQTIDTYIGRALREMEEQKSLPFVVKYQPTGKIIGTTRYMNLVPQHKRLEIGGTWYAKSFQKTGVNTACKYLLLEYAFENLECIAVEFRTHWHNIASRNAITRLGAKQDGVLRNHQLGTDGTYRDTVVFSIINNEWLTVKKSLAYKMSKYGS